MRRLGSRPRPAGAPPIRVVDVGTGSGAIAIALAVALRRLRRARGGRDPARRTSRRTRSGLARENAVGHAVADRIAFAEADLLPAGDRRTPFDLVLANLPYVRTDAIADAAARDVVRAGRRARRRAGRARRHRPAARPAAGRARAGTASRCSRSGRTRARRSSSSSRARLPGWACVVEADLAGPAAGRADRRVGDRDGRPRRAAAQRERSATVGHHQDVPVIASPDPILPDPPGRARHRRDARRRRPRHRAGHAGGDPRGARARGVAVTLITGRMVSSALRFARELDLTAPIVGYQGGLIREMPAAGLDAARAAAHPHAAPARRSRATSSLWTRAAGPRPAREPPRAVHPPRGRPAGRRLHGVHGRPRPTSRTTCRVDPAPGHQGHGRRRAAAPDRGRAAGPGPRSPGVADVTISHPQFLEFVAPGVSKGRAVRWLARRLGVALGAILAIGDQWNDIEMLAEVGHGAAMPTAPVEVQAVARYIAPPLAEEGVARMIESLVLAGPRDARAAAAERSPTSGQRRAARRRRSRPGVSARIVPDDAAGRARGHRGAAGRRDRRPADRHRLRHRASRCRRRAASSACSR